MVWDSQAIAGSRAAVAEATREEKQTALGLAADYIDATFRFRGVSSSIDQVRSWPRNDAFRDDGTPILGVPDAVKTANLIVAGFILGGVPLDDELRVNIRAIFQPLLCSEEAVRDPLPRQISESSETAEVVLDWKRRKA